ncbi:hypothetical protein YC2023_106636 [Brassica napus]
MRLALVDLSKVRECRENSFWISLRKSFLSRQKLLDFGEVKISYISFFDIKKHETVNSRWDLELGQEQMRFDIGKEKEVKLVKKCLG